MDRRSFLATAFAAGLLPHSKLFAASSCVTGQALDDPMLAYLMLSGGPDFRHMFPPAYSSVAGSFGNKYWEIRQRAHSIGDTNSAWETRWNDDFHHQSAGGTTFGIIREAGWLNTMYEAGNVAIICNAVGSLSRNHELSTRIMDYGNLETTTTDINRSGWGGRLAKAAGGNCVSLTRVPREFCFGPHASGDINRFDKSNLIGMSNSRSAGLYRYSGTNYRGDTSSRLERALESLYAGSRDEFGGLAPQTRIFETERKLREFGEKINDVLDACPIPPEIEALYRSNILPDQPNRLVGRYGFGEQVRNLYDAILVNKDLGLKVASMEYGGWDSHQNQREGIEDNFRDIFGEGRGLDMLWRNLSEDDRANLAIVICGEFGRQIKDNGGNGTDHGRGNIMLVIGENVNGGVYGEMFPESELAKLDQRSPDIDAKTEFDHVYGEVCDWVSRNSGDVVFPFRADRMIEESGMFNNLIG